MVLLVRAVKFNPGKKGRPYVEIHLFDGESTQKINDFNNTVEGLNAKGIKEDAIVCGTVSINEKGYLNMDNCRLNMDPSIKREDFKHVAPIDPDENFKWLLRQVKSVDTNPTNQGERKSIAHLTLKLLQENEEEFKRSSAAETMHHNFLAGLLYHTVRMVSVASQICKTYKDLDEELLVCGAALHDIGKIHCYITDDIGDAKISIEGNLYEHLHYGMCMIEEAAKREVYSAERVRLLVHMIAAHHGTLEWGAVVTPKFKEAMVLHFVDMIDSRMNMFEEAYKGQESWKCFRLIVSVTHLLQDVRRMVYHMKSLNLTLDIAEKK